MSKLQTKISAASRTQGILSILGLTEASPKEQKLIQPKGDQAKLHQNVGVNIRTRTKMRANLRDTK